MGVVPGYMIPVARMGYHALIGPLVYPFSGPNIEL